MMLKVRIPSIHEGTIPIAGRAIVDARSPPIDDR